MSDFLERVPDELPEEVEQVANLGEREKEKLAELAVMLKAQRLFEIPRPDDDPYRFPDDVTQYELMKEVFSFLRDKDGVEKRDRRTLVYRRLLTNEGGLIKDSQVIEYRESDNTVEVVITCDRFPDNEVPVDILKRVEDFIDYHLERAAPTARQSGE